jgi:glycosyltransferase involved in cell wall biosynthesis
MGEIALSVVMAAYNAEATIAQAMESVLRQTFGDFEFVIVDDGSSDGTAEVALKFSDPRVKVVRNAQNIGLAPSLRRGLQHASGAYIARMDADDACQPERFQRQLDFLRAHPEVGVVGTSFHLMDDGGRLFDSRVRPGEDEYLQKELLRWNPFCAGSLTMRADLLRSLGGYDERFPTSEDCDLLLRFAERARLAILSDVLYSWRVRAQSMTHADRGKQLHFAGLARELAWQRRLRGRDRFGRRLRLCPARGRERHLLAEHAVVWGREALRQGRMAAAAALLARAAFLCPTSARLWRAALRAPRAAARGLEA